MTAQVTYLDDGDDRGRNDDGGGDGEGGGGKGSGGDCCLLVGCLTSQQHASVSQGRICSDNFTCCHTETEVADQTFHHHPVTVY